MTDALIILAALVVSRLLFAQLTHMLLRAVVREMNLMLVSHGISDLSKFFHYAELPKRVDVALDPTLWTARAALRKYIVPQLRARGFTKTADVLDEL